MSEIYFKTQEEYDTLANMMVEHTKKEFFEALYKVYNDNEEEFISYATKNIPELTEKECREAFLFLRVTEGDNNND